GFGRSNAREGPARPATIKATRASETTRLHSDEPDIIVLLFRQGHGRVGGGVFHVGPTGPGYSQGVRSIGRLKPRLHGGKWAAYNRRRRLIVATYPRRRPFTVAEYYAMARAGILSEDDRVELIKGEIVEMSPIGDLHAAAVTRAQKLFERRIGDRAIVRVQN